MKTSNKLFYAGQPIRCVRYAGRGSFELISESGQPAIVTPTTSDEARRLSDYSRCSTGRPNQLPEDSELRNSYPMADGLIDYFPNALAEVSRVSYIGNQKHNPGEPMNWARGKSTDHRNKIARHLVDAGGFEETEVDGKTVKVRHSAYLAWRALANLQEEIERDEGYPMSRGSTPPAPRTTPYEDDLRRRFGEARERSQ